jgi:hypothetical protein
MPRVQVPAYHDHFFTHRNLSRLLTRWEQAKGQINEG